MRLRLFCILLPLLLLPCANNASTQIEDQAVEVAVASCPPFVISEGEKFTGLAMYLWHEVALSLNLKYTVTEFSSSVYCQPPCEVVDTRLCCGISHYS